MYQSYTLELEALAQAMLEKGASDLFLSAGRPPMIRLNRELLELTGNKVVSGEEIAGLMSALVTPEQLHEFEERHVLNFSFDHKNIARFRVHAYRQRGGTSLVFRSIPQAIPSLESLNIPSTVKSFTTLTRGLVLFTSPTGGGKTTTLASLLDFINHTQAKRILTLEQPIEYLLQSDRSICEQQEVGRDLMSFEEGIDQSLLASIDVLMVGEMTSPLAMEKALFAAEAGQLVFVALNTMYAENTLSWILDLYPTARQVEIRTRLSNVLCGMVTQQLIPTIDEHMTPALEILIGTPAIRNAIREGKIYQIDDMVATGFAEGMLSLDRSLVELVKHGYVAKEAVTSFVRDIPTFESLLQG